MPTRSLSKKIIIKLDSLDYELESMSVDFKDIQNFDDKTSINKILFLMVKLDAHMRSKFIELENEIDISLKQQYLKKIASLLHKYDSRNTLILKKIIDKHGWIDISRFGNKASEMAWLLIQHADHDQDFQEQMLKLIEEKLSDGEVNPRNYAYLYDRVMLKKYGKQKFGTQLQKDEDGKLVVRQLEDLKNVDEYRKECGLEPLSSYINSAKDIVK